MMGMTTFLLRLVGRDPVQIREADRFTSNLRQLDETEEDLDRLRDDIRTMDTAVKKKAELLSNTAASIRPSPIPEEEEFSDADGSER